MAMYNYTPNAYGYYEDDEEERRRKEQEQAQGFGAIEPIAPLGIEPVETQPIKQTITYDPVSGEQRMKIEGSVQDLSPSNAMTPTVTMPGQQPAPVEPVREMVQPTDLVPQQAPVQQPQQLPPGVQMVNGKLQLAPTTPVEPMTQAQAEMPAQEPMPQIPQPGPAVQVAGPAQMPPAAQPAAAQPMDPIGMFTSAVGDVNKLFQIRNDTSLNPEVRRMAGREAGRQLTAETEQIKAQERVSQMTPVEISRELRKSSEEGSWTKRVLFGLLNMQGAMAAEDAKLGIGAKYQSSMLNGEPVEIKVRADGKPMEGFNAATMKPLSQRELVTAAANMSVLKGTQAATATRVRDSKGTEWSQVPTTQGMKFYNNQGQAGVPEGRTVPITAGSDLELEQAKADIKTIAQFSGMTAQARLNAYENTNKLRADRNLPQKTLEEMGLNSDGSLIGEAVRRAGAPVTLATSTPPVTSATATPPVTSATATPPPVSTQRTPPVVAQSGTGSGVRTGGGATTLPAGTIPTAAQMAEASKESDLNRAIREAAAKAQINVGQNLEEQKNKIRMTMPSSEQNANRVLATLNDIATHPGLDKTVGLPKLLSTPLSMIPSTEQRGFAQKFKQLGGQEFLAAYDQLRGGGGISETEGLKAEQAISALKDTGISPAEFKKNMWIFRDAVQTGLDKQRELIGLPPKYRESPDREAAKDWLRNNPNSPKAEAVRRKLVGF